MATLQEQLQYAVDTKNLIKDAIKNKGVHISDTDPFRRYPEKINAIPAYAPVWLLDEDNFVSDVRLSENVTIPTAVNGTPLDNGFRIPNDILADQILSTTKKITIPEYFISATIANFGNARSRFLEEIEYDGARLYGLDVRTFEYLDVLHKLTFPNLTGAVSFWAARGASNVQTEFTLIAPKVTEAFFDLGTATRSIELKDFDLQNCQIFGYTAPETDCLRFVKGSLSLPSCTTLRAISQSTENFTLYTPQLTTNTVEAFKYKGTDSVLTWYIGPSLSTLNSATISNITGDSGKFNIHIPEGESTTKATLDTAGISYTQDYVI